MKYYVKTYGCAMNYADSNNIRNILNQCGLIETKNLQDANYLIINSCSIRKQAEDKVEGWKMKLKKKGIKPDKIILTGCMASRYNRQTNEIEQKYLQNLKKRFSWVDEIIPIEEIGKISSTLKKECYDIEYKPFCNNPATDGFNAMIPISSGCDNFCSYCIVPYTRGRQANLDCGIIIDRVKLAVSKGYKLITLLGQNVNSWQNVTKEGNLDFADLLKKVCAVEGDFWVNFLSSNPMDWTDKLTETLVSEPKIMKWCNIAVQSGSDKILKKMNRKYTVKRFIEIVNSLKKRDADFRVFTDLIVGFSGESEQDWQSSLDLISKMDIEMVYSGKYSVREGTSASKYCDDDVKLSEKVGREKQLVKLVNGNRLRSHSMWAGKKMKVLIQYNNRGVSHYNHDVIFDSVDDGLLGSFCEVVVTDANVKGLMVKLI